MYSDLDVNYIDDTEFNDQNNYEEDLKGSDHNKKWLIIIILVLVLVCLIIMVMFKFKSDNKEDVRPTIKILMDKTQIKINEMIDLDVQLKNNSHNNLVWESSKKEVATVNEKGEVTGINLGKTNIFVKYIHSNNEQYTEECEITVYQGNIDSPLKNFKVDEEIKLKIGNSGQIKIDFDPIDAYIYSIKYESLNKEIVDVDSNGIIKGNKVGNSEITVTVNNVINKKIKVIVYEEEKEDDSNKLNIKPSSVRFNQDSIDIMVNEEKKLNYIVLPQGVNNYNVSFENSNNTVLQVNQDGTIKGISIGKSIVKVKINNTYEASINVNVLPYVVHVESLILKSNANLTLNVNDTSEILYEINPSNASNKTVIFTSSNIEVATVDSNGIIKAISKGSAIITVKTSDKDKVINVNVVVN